MLREVTHLVPWTCTFVLCFRALHAISCPAGAFPAGPTPWPGGGMQSALVGATASQAAGMCAHRGRAGGRDSSTPILLYAWIMYSSGWMLGSRGVGYSTGWWAGVGLSCCELRAAETSSLGTHLVLPPCYPGPSPGGGASLYRYLS